MRLRRDRAIERAVRPRRRRRARRSVILLAMASLFLLSPFSPASAAIPSPPINTNPNDVCAPDPNPAAEPYGSGVDGMIKQPDYPSEKLKTSTPQKMTYYDRYGTSGQYWYATDMGCADAMAMMGNAVANTTFTLAKAIDRTTISVYQAAASESLLGWLKKTVDGVISGVGKTFGAQYWTWVVILGAMWLAWMGLLRRRASKVAEGTIWMVAAMVGLTWLIARPADFTTLGTTVSEATSVAFNAALPQSDTKGTVCVPPPAGQSPPSSVNLDATTRNANGLWVALVCKPWLMGEFGTTDPNSKIVKDNADKLLWSQAVDLSETYGGQKVDLDKKADAYKEVASDIKENHPGAYSTFQGKQWTSRLAVAFGGLFAALVAGLLIMVIAIALIVVKIAFLLLLVAGPIFLGIGIHPGIGRVIAIRWLELLLSMLLKQAALIGVLALLLWAYGLILGETLPWGLQILLIALVTGAAFVYRKPFQHLFASVGYSAVGSRAKSEEHLEKSISEVRKNTTAVATAAVPGAAGYRLARWGKRDSAEGGALADVSPGADGAASDPAGVVAGRGQAADGGTGAAVAGAGRSRAGAPPLNLPSRGGSPRRDSGTPVAASGGRASDGALRSARGTGTKAVGPVRATDGGRALAGGGSGGSGGGSGASGGSGGSSGGSGGSRPTGPPGGPPGTSRPTSWGGGRTTSGGGSASGGGGAKGRGGGGGTTSGGGGATAGGSAGTGGRGGWFGGRGDSGSSGDEGGGGAVRGGGSGGGRARRAGRSGGKKPASEPASGVPKPRTGGESGPRDERRPPPLWGKESMDDEPSMPFWLRPVDRDD
ncbi:type IV secretion system protein [Actinomadura sp. HBU206391]|uniref:type IV secretion system protein n=1 Tax=Actinomadura sp. HBU206391 TaxID=2731692 RepID=UPI00164FE567|nr:type IV secretion system protein [Actinomadura sp. HBU206391]MBC6457506.1 type IV secretion system protein [Actinomadura sp. HBU206391]